MGRFNDGLTGRLFEEVSLGTCRAVHRGYMRWHEAVETVRKNQPPLKAPMAARLEREVRAQIGEAVRFFTAVRSTLDVMHGCDGFFEFHGIVVTIDLTMNHCKDSAKADLLIQREETTDIPVLAGRVAREMRSKLLRRA